MSLLESLQNSIETVVLAAEANAHLVDGGSFPTATLEAARQLAQEFDMRLKSEPVPEVQAT